MANRQLNLKDTDAIKDLVYTRLEDRYLKVLTVRTALTYIIIMCLCPLPILAWKFPGAYIILACAEILLLAAFITNMLILPKANELRGYAVREHDITYRKGLFFPKETTIPFCKIQQVSVRQTPVSRMFGLYTVDIVNGAQMIADISIPGLSEESAGKIKALTIQHIRDGQD